MDITPFRALTMRHLQCFTLLVAERNFSRAAGRLAITQPALSNAIKQLERIVGTQLLRRSTHQLELTEAGTQLLERASFLVNTFERTLVDIDSVVRKGRAVIRVGTIPSASMLLAGCIDNFSRRAGQQVVFEIEDALSDALVARTRAGQLDVAITAVTEPPEGLTSVALFDDPIVLVVPRTHKLAGAASTSWRKLGDAQLVTFAAGSMPALGDMARAQFSRGGAEPLRVNHLETLYSMVRTGLALGLMPRLYTASLKDPALAVIRLQRPSMHRTVSLVYRGGARRNLQIGQFIDDLETRLPRAFTKHAAEV